MRFLILTQYFPPETGAPQNRLLQLAKRLQKLGVEVTVLTAMPNYPQMRIYDGYRNKFYCFEFIEGIPVHRSWIYSGTSKAIVPRLINYFSFVKTSFLVGLFKIKKQDFILCESPPLFLGMSAWLLSKFKGARMIFNVSDLWPESAEKLGLVTNRSLLNLSTWLEEFLYRHSVIVTGQTKGIVNNIASRFPNKCVFWLKNGADMEEISSIPADTDWRVSNGFSDHDFLLLYAGIIGHAQGLEVILKAANLLRDKPEIKFLLAGSGPLRDQLITLKNSLNLTNVFFLENRPKHEVVPIIHAADIALIPLRKLDLFKGAIPSKIFENLALHKPILLGVEGEALELFIDQGGAGWSFEPENSEDLASKIRYLSDNRHLLKEAGNNGFDYLCREFNLDVVAAEFHSLINEKSAK
ncbi:MAG: glycosyltransferase family 4 protein [Bacteroidota bacterium]